MTFVLDEKEITRELVIQGADLERQLTLDDGHLGAVPWVIGAHISQMAKAKDAMKRVC